jgi:hypothetical protein
VVEQRGNDISGPVVSRCRVVLPTEVQGESDDVPHQPASASLKLHPDKYVQEFIPVFIYV